MFENLNTSHHGALETDDNHLKRCPACRRKALKRQADQNRGNARYGTESRDNNRNKLNDLQNSQDYDKEIQEMLNDLTSSK